MSKQEDPSEEKQGTPSRWNSEFGVLSFNTTNLTIHGILKQAPKEVNNRVLIF